MSDCRQSDIFMIPSTVVFCVLYGTDAGINKMSEFFSLYSFYFSNCQLTGWINPPSSNGYITLMNTVTSIKSYKELREKAHNESTVPYFTLVSPWLSGFESCRRRLRIFWFVPNQYMNLSHCSIFRFESFYYGWFYFYFYFCSSHSVYRFVSYYGRGRCWQPRAL